MKIVFLVRELRNDGIAMYCLRLAELLSLECHLVTSRISIEDESLRRRVFGAYAGVHERPDLFGSVSLGSWRRIRLFLRARRFDVVHVHELHLLSLFSLPARSLRIPIVGTSHLQAAGSQSWNQWQKRLFAMGLSRVLCSAYVAISSEIEAEYRELYRIPQSRIRKVLTGIDLSYFRPPDPIERQAARRRFGLGDGDLVFLQLGRLAEVKAPDTTLKTIYGLRNVSGRSIKLLYAGEGPMLAELRREARQLRIENDVQFLGFQSARDVLWAADALCLPSRAEGFAMVVVEAMACGVVPLRSRTPGYIDQIAGMGNLGDLDPDNVDKNLSVIAPMLDGVTRERVADECLDWVRDRFNQYQMRDGMTEVYESLVGTSSPGALVAPLSR